MKTQEEIAEAIKDFLFEDEKNRYAFVTIVDEENKDITKVLKGTGKNLIGMLAAIMCQHEDFRNVIISAVMAYHEMAKTNNYHADC